MDERSYIELISGRRAGHGASAMRAVLHGLSWIYGGMTDLRNAYYDYWAQPVWLDVPVISVGNLTVGGTGKTPMTIRICQELLERGIKPAVLSRGYRADEEGWADELMLITRHCPQAVAVGHANRVAAGQMAIEKYQVKAAVLDDGFQHRRLGRDRDIVLIDALEPWGYGHILPRGLLREHPKNLRRADLVVITRCNQATFATVDSIEAAIHDLEPEIPVIRVIHRPAGFVDLLGEEMNLAGSDRIGCFAGIGRPEAFARTMADIGRAPADTFWWPDHHAYGREDIDELSAWVADADLDALVTTEKDAVKLAKLDVDWPAPIAALRVEIAFLGDGDKILARLIDQMLQEHQDARRPQPRPDEEAR